MRVTASTSNPASASAWTSPAWLNTNHSSWPRRAHRRASGAGSSDSGALTVSSTSTHPRHLTHRFQGAQWVTDHLQHIPQDHQVELADATGVEVVDVQVVVGDPGAQQLGGGPEALAA